MGVWWEKVNVRTPHEYAVGFAGDSSAMPKSFPLVWRKMQDWHCLRVTGGWSQQEFDGGYRLFFATDTITMKYRYVLRSRFVMVREGPERVRFWVMDTNGVLGTLERTGRMSPAHRFRPDRSDAGAPTLRQLQDQGQISWV